MSESITFKVIGTPMGKGSFTRMPNGAMLRAGTPKSRKAEKVWRETCEQTAREAMNGRKISTAAIRIMVEFRMPVPKTIRKAQWGWYPHLTYPDVDKLQREIFDAFTEIIWVDDSRVVSVVANKVYAWDENPGAVVVVDFMPHSNEDRPIINALETL